MNCKSIIKVVAVAMAVSAFCVGCGDGGDKGTNPGGGSYTYTGKTVTIGSQVWMAENLNRETAQSGCYDNNPDNCVKYGRLYTWNAAVGACPSGWHLPSDAEWTQLMDFVGGQGIAGKKLKSTSGWDDDSKGNTGNGTDDFGFSALPGGGSAATNTVSGGFSLIGSSGVGEISCWWSSTEFSELSAGYWMIASSDALVGGMTGMGKTSYAASVRCVKN